MSPENLSRRSMMTAAAILAAAPSVAVPAAFAAPTIAATLPADIVDRAGMVARAKQIVEILGCCYVREGWHEFFDKQHAGQFVESVGARLVPHEQPSESPGVCLPGAKTVTVGS